MTARSPSSREVFLYRWSGSIAAWAAVVTPLVSYLLFVLLSGPGRQLPWRPSPVLWFALARSILCLAAGGLGFWVGCRHRRVGTIVAGVAALLSGLTQVFMVLSVVSFISAMDSAQSRGGGLMA